MLLELCFSVEQLQEVVKSSYTPTSSSHSDTLSTTTTTTTTTTPPPPPPPPTTAATSNSTTINEENVMCSIEKETEICMTIGEEDDTVGLYNWETLSGRLLSDETVDWKVGSL